MASLRGFQADPQHFYDWFRPLLHTISAARPNPAHLALAGIERLGKLKAIITQNIDGLHAARRRRPRPRRPRARHRRCIPEPRGDGFAIQVAALTGKSEAEAVADRLKRKGYAVYVLSAPSGQPAANKVRVGEFKARTEAEKIATRLEREEQFKPWITR